MPSPPRTSGFSCSRLSLHYSRACAAETQSAHPRSPPCRIATPGRISYALFPYCSHTTGPYPARAWPVALHARMPAESSRPLAKLFRSHSRTRRFNSARTSVWMKRAGHAWLHHISSELVTADRCLHSATSPSDLPHHKRSSASARIKVCSHLATSKSS
jgi:hypothetical protein